MKRTAKIERKTTETDVNIELCLDGGNVQITSGIGFFDHMLTLFASHGDFGVILEATGDTHIDYHHTVEDIGIVLGKAFYEAAGDKKGINRYGNFLLPMDEALAEVVLDFGGRSFLHFDAKFKTSKIGNFDTQLVEEFFRAFAFNSKMSIHINLRYGTNDHHISEAIFKCFARALKQALAITSAKIPSTKGIIE